MPSELHQSHHGKLAALSAEIEHCTARLDALTMLLQKIKDNPAFTTTEQYCLEARVREAKDKVYDLTQLQNDQQNYIDTTLKQFTRDIAERERVLNEVFAHPTLAEHNDLMEMFREQHLCLRKNIEEVEQ